MSVTLALKLGLRLSQLLLSFDELFLHLIQARDEVVVPFGNVVSLNHQLFTGVGEQPNGLG